MSNNKETWVSFKDNANDNKIEITYQVNIRVIKKESGRFSCFINGFNIYFGANDNDIIMKKAFALTRAYFDNFMEHMEKNRLKKLVLDLHKKGFKADNDITTVHKLVNNHFVPAKFKSTSVVPRDFVNSPSINHASKFQVATA